MPYRPVVLFLFLGLLVSCHGDVNSDERPSYFFNLYDLKLGAEARGDVAAWKDILHPKTLERTEAILRKRNRDVSAELLKALSERNGAPVFPDRKKARLEKSGAWARLYYAGEEIEKAILFRREGTDWKFVATVSARTDELPDKSNPKERYKNAPQLLWPPDESVFWPQPIELALKAEKETCVEGEAVLVACSVKNVGGIGITRAELERMAAMVTVKLDPAPGSAGAGLPLLRPGRLAAELKPGETCSLGFYQIKSNKAGAYTIVGSDGINQSAPIQVTVATRTGGPANNADVKENGREAGKTKPVAKDGGKTPAKNPAREPVKVAARR